MGITDSKVLDQAREAVIDMIYRSESIQTKFPVGSSQHTLQANRIRALNIARSALDGALGKIDELPYKKEAIEKAVGPLQSLFGKSEKAKSKLKPESWQYKMLDRNIRALSIALSFIENGVKDGTCSKPTKTSPGR